MPLQGSRSTAKIRPSRSSIAVKDQRGTDMSSSLVQAPATSAVARVAVAGEGGRAVPVGATLGVPPGTAGAALGVEAGAEQPTRRTRARNAVPKRHIIATSTLDAAYETSASAGCDPAARAVARPDPAGIVLPLARSARRCFRAEG